MVAVFCLLVSLIITDNHGGDIPGKSFHDHISDFMDLITKEKGDDLRYLMTEYESDDEFQKTMEYLRSQDFIDIFAEMQRLPEFTAMFDYLEANHIPILELLEYDNKILGIENQMTIFSWSHRNLRKGVGFNGLLRDIIDILPKASLSFLFDQKITSDDQFRYAMNSGWRFKRQRGEAKL